MNFNIQPINKELFEHVQAWKAKRKLPALKPILLSTTGYVVTSIKTSMPIAAMWLYYTNSSIIMFEELITNPESDKKERNEAIDFLLDFSVDVSKNLGYKVIMALSNNDLLMNRLKRHKFDLINENMLQYVKIVDGGNR